MIPKFDAWRSRAWLDWVKTLPSCISGRPADDPHHIKGYSYITGSGGSIKGDDLFVIPLTRDEHAAFDHIGCESWEAKYGSQLEHWARVMRLAVKLGVFRFSTKGVPETPFAPGHGESDEKEREGVIPAVPPAAGVEANTGDGSLADRTLRV